MNLMLGFSAGVMIAASFWSLLSPAIERAEMYLSVPPWFVAAIGFAFGSRFLGRYWNLQAFLDPCAGGKIEQGTGEGSEGRNLVFFIEACGKIITYRIFTMYNEYHFRFR